jgi:serine/threonine protein kinase
VHQKNIKLADFGLSKKIAELSNTPRILGVIPYIDPKSFDNQYNINDQSNNYKLNKKSDVYSIGVIMWQISSGRQPFYIEGIEYNVTLALAILSGKRESIVDDTPIEYSTLYNGKK